MSMNDNPLLKMLFISVGVNVLLNIPISSRVPIQLSVPPSFLEPILNENKFNIESVNVSEVMVTLCSIESMNKETPVADEFPL